MLRGIRDAALFTLHMALVLYLVFFPWLPARAATTVVSDGDRSSSSSGGSQALDALRVVDEVSLYTYMLLGVGVIAHWVSNSEDCALTLLEHWLRGTARGGGWLDRVVGPVFGLPRGYWRWRKYGVAAANGTVGACRLHWEFGYRQLPATRTWLQGQFAELHAVLASPLVAAVRALGMGTFVASSGSGSSSGSGGIVHFLAQWIKIGVYGLGGVVAAALVLFWGARLAGWLRARARRGFRGVE